MAAQFLGVREDWEETINGDVFRRAMVARARTAGMAKEFLIAENFPYLNVPIDHLCRKLHRKYNLGESQIQALAKFLRLKFQENDNLDIFQKEITQVTTDWLKPSGNQGNEERFIISTVACMKFFESLHEDLYYKVLGKRPMSLAMAVYFAKEILENEKIETTQEQEYDSSESEIRWPEAWEQDMPAQSIIIAEQNPVEIDLETKQWEEVYEFVRKLKPKPPRQNSATHLNVDLTQEKGMDMIVETKNRRSTKTGKAREPIKCKNRNPKVDWDAKKPGYRLAKFMNAKRKFDNKKGEHRIWKKGWLPPNTAKKKQNYFPPLRKKQTKSTSVKFRDVKDPNKHGLNTWNRRPPKKPIPNDSVPKRNCTTRYCPKEPPDRIKDMCADTMWRPFIPLPNRQWKFEPPPWV